MLNRKTARLKGTTEETQATDAEVQPPTLRSIAPRYAALADRWAELCSREESLYSELAPIVQRLAKAGAYSEHANLSTMPRPAPPREYSPGVAAQIADLVPFERPAPIPPTAVSDLKAQAARTSAELTDIAEAKKQLLPALRAAQFAGSAAFIDAVRPQYSLVARRVCDALLELGTAWTEHQLFVREIHAQGATITTLRPVRITDADSAADPIAAIGRALKWASDSGHLDITRVPPEWLVR